MTPSNGYILNANIRCMETKTLSASKKEVYHGNKYSLAKWGCILCVVNVFFFYQHNNLKKFLNSIQSLEKSRGRHICQGYL